jgi:hypothetical protein
MIIRSDWYQRLQPLPAPIATPTAAAIADAHAADESLNLELLAAARAARATGPGAMSNAPGQAPPTGEPSHLAFDLVGIGPNITINASQGFRIAIYQLLLYNAGEAQTIALKGGTLDLMGPIRALGAGVGLFLPWCDHPYFTLEPGQPFIIEGSALAAGPLGSEVTGFLKYRMLDGSNS